MLQQLLINNNITEDQQHNPENESDLDDKNLTKSN